MKNIRITERNKEFVESIERMVSDGQVTYIEAITEYCEKKNIDPATIKRLIPKPIKERMEAEAIRLNYIKSDSQELPDVD